MKNFVRVSGLLAVLALMGITSSGALRGYHPGDCAYECSNAAGDTIKGTTQASPGACCAGTASFPCPVGYTYSGTDFYVDSIGPEVCE